MSPDPGRTYTVGCSFDKLIPDEAHRTALRDALSRVHKSTILATELLNLQVRLCIEDCREYITHTIHVASTPQWSLFSAIPPVRQMNEEEREFHRPRFVCEPCATS